MRWTAPDGTSFCALHFNCKQFTEPFGNKTFLPQKISGHPEYYDDFAYLRDHIHITEDVLRVFSVLYGLCDKLYSNLSHQSIVHIDERIQRAVDYLNENYRWHISVEELARISNLSPSRFYHRFKAETGMTPIEYKNDLCIKYAITQLVGDPQKSIEEISAESGFESSTYFRRVFKSVMKRTPREYRKVVSNYAMM
ncbi:MAG: helix-turn-helix transcriptional regulator [Clostridia bacterium]|nr:helix-turn-helix transcriptional regulator [Clostridia bacterium]